MYVSPLKISYTHADVSSGTNTELHIQASCCLISRYFSVERSFSDEICEHLKSKMFS